MTLQPIGPTAHGALDYGFTVAQFAAPALLGLRGTARALAYGFLAVTTTVNVLTDHPLALKRVIPFRVHGTFDYAVVPALLALPWATGALKQKSARRYFVSLFASALVNVLLTDYDADEH